MSNDGTWRPEGDHGRPDADATRQVPASELPGAHGSHAAGGAAAGGAASTPPTYSPSTGGASAYSPGGGYGGAGGAGYGGPGDGGYGDEPPEDGRSGRFPWVGVIVAVLAVAAAAVAVWYFLLRDTGSEEGTAEPSGESSSESVSAAPPGEETRSEDEESADPEESTSEDETATEDESAEADEAPTSGTGEDPESPSEDGSDDATDGAEGPEVDATFLEIGETHTLSDGMEVTLDEAERGQSCVTSPGSDYTALTFTIVGGEGDTPGVPPQPGVTLSVPGVDISPVDAIACAGDDALPPVVESGEEVTGTVLVPEPDGGPFDVVFSPTSSIVSGGSEDLAWTIE